MSGLKILISKIKKEIRDNNQSKEPSPVLSLKLKDTSLYFLMQKNDLIHSGSASCKPLSSEQPTLKRNTTLFKDLFC